MDVAFAITPVHQIIAFTECEVQRQMLTRYDIGYEWKVADIKVLDFIKVVTRE